MDEDFTPGKNQRICPTCKKEAKKIIAEFDRKKADIVREHYPRVPRRRS